jgi:uncharacterized protein YrrD
VDLGPPSSYLALEKGTPVYSSDGAHVGRVTHVLVSEGEDLFEGVVIEEHLGPGGHRFVDADQIADIHTGGVLLALDREQAAHLPEPASNPPVMREDTAGTGHGSLQAKLRRAWEHITGDY